MQLLRASFPSRVASDLLIQGEQLKIRQQQIFQQKDISKITSQMNTFDIKYTYIYIHTHNSLFILLFRKKK